MRQVDRLMVDKLGISLLQMMENAGRNLAVLARTLLGGDVFDRCPVRLGAGDRHGAHSVRAGGGDADSCASQARPPRSRRPDVVGSLFAADISVPPLVYRRVGAAHPSPFGRGPIVHLGAAPP
jgi:hypothetical protein